MNKFRMLSSGEDVLADNYRRLQEIGNRKVYVRRMDANFATNVDMINLDPSKLRWQWE